jgi:hypothetical protein
LALVKCKSSTTRLWHSGFFQQLWRNHPFWIGLLMVCSIYRWPILFFFCFGTWLKNDFPFHMLGIILTKLTDSYFSWWLKPPTRIRYDIIIYILYIRFIYCIYIYIFFSIHIIYVYMCMIHRCCRDIYIYIVFISCI